ncbi:hypothetical protein GA0070620_3470 [Micromonospora krabiensis]|uniref:Uncharacterized protein n=1 Tax=Micromonospora krabiensis TaxID=307121 RepID=A0A1C3N5S3_9ACTN|nr:hypothetical protein GA0070620_3470 [Micromonospora krabiensis]
MKKEITVCDVCQNPNLPVTTYEVRANGRKGQTDRCDDHGAELAAIVAPSPAPRRGRPPGRVVSMDEVEAAKAQK